MKYVFIIIIGIMFFNSKSEALDSLSYRMSFVDDSGNTCKNIQFGIHKDATDSIDYFLNEKKLPDISPPSGILAVFAVVDSSYANPPTYWTYNDYRPIPSEDRFFKFHRILLKNIAFAYTISWPKIGNYIDSIYLKDIINGKLINIDMKTTQSVYIENSGMDKFNIEVYYNKNTIDIDENKQTISDEEIYINPNPVKEGFNLSLSDPTSSCYIYNHLGQITSNYKMNSYNEYINFSGMPAGIYYIKVVSDNGRVMVNKFIKY